MKKQKLIVLLPFILAILIMLPRLASPQFDLLDDPIMLSHARETLDGNFDLSSDFQSGRFRPLYWLYSTLIYLLAGARPFWFYFSTLILLLVLLAEIRTLMRFYGATERQFLIASVIFLISIPIIENYYTLGKGEPLQLVFLLAGLIAFEKFCQSQKNTTRWVWGALIFGSFLAAAMVKETAIAIAGISLVWLVWNGLQRKKQPPKVKRNALILFLITLAVVATFFLCRAIWGVSTIAQGAYTQRYALNWEEISSKLVHWLVQLSFNFHYLLPFAIVLFIVRRRGDTEKPNAQIIFWLIWWLVWIGVLIPWDYAETYYLLPFSLGTAILAGLSLPNLVRVFQGKRGWRKTASTALIALSGLLFLSTLPNLWTYAQQQLTISRINAAMLQSAAENLAPDGTARVNILVENEYTYNMELTLRNDYDRREIKFSHLREGELDQLSTQTGALILVPYVNNLPNLSVRIGVQESSQRFWNESLFRKNEANLKKVTTLSGSFKNSNINLPVLICPLLGERGFCESPDPLIDTRLFSYGWELYRIE